MSTKKRSQDSRNLSVTEHEGMLLSLVLRQQPVTAYQIYKIYKQSPVTTFNTSKGQVYPAIRRLAGRGLIKAAKLPRDRRNVEELSVTTLGRSAVKIWTKEIGAAQIVLDDPLRTRLFSLDLLTREEQLEWIATAKHLIKERRRDIDEYDRSVNVPFQDFAYRSVIDVLRVKAEWLDDLLCSLAAGRKSQ